MQLIERNSQMEIAEEKHLSGKTLSPGIAIGKVFIVEESIKTSSESPILDVEQEIDRFRQLVNHIADDLSNVYESISQEIDPSEAGIIETQRMFVLDDGFQKKVLKLIAAEFLSAEMAAEKVLKNVAMQLTNAKSDYLKQRADDFFDLAKYFQNKASGKTGLSFHEFNEDTIIKTSELLPSTVLSCRKTRVKGIITDQGAPTSHAAILAKSLGIPVLIGFSDLIVFIRNDQTVILDGYEGDIILEPNSEILSLYKNKLKKLQISFIQTKNIFGKPAVTADGTPVSIFVNIERPDELDTIALHDIDGIGLFRTEFLFMYEQSDFPTLEQQFKWYRETINFMKGKPVTIRILDVGGDKFLPYFAMGNQANPYLGLRGNRVFRYHPELLETQMQAILKAAQGGKVRILYPMVNTLEDIELFKNVLSNINQKYDAEIKVGIMIETPASVFLIRDLIKEVDFVSIGTNDLVQYTLTVDRNNENVMQYYKPTMPIIIKMIEKVVRTAREFDKSYSVCGEVASDPLWVPLLLGLGFRELSIAPNTIYSIKQKIQLLDLRECMELTSRVLAARYESEVSNLLKEFDKYLKAKHYRNGIHNP